jgi:hypothetical protein
MRTSNPKGTRAIPPPPSCHSYAFVANQSIPRLRALQVLRGFLPAPLPKNKYIKKFGRLSHLAPTIQTSRPYSSFHLAT